jgi:maltooligosyltrehalose synthase
MTGDGTTEVALPLGEWHDVVSDHAVVSNGSVSIATLLAEFPVAVLER